MRNNYLHLIFWVGFLGILSNFLGCNATPIVLPDNKGNGENNVGKTDGAIVVLFDMSTTNSKGDASNAAPMRDSAISYDIPNSPKMDAIQQTDNGNVKYGDARFDGPLGDARSDSTIEAGTSSTDAKIWFEVSTPDSCNLSDLAENNDK
jgi:hypothetical protein